MSSNPRSPVPEGVNDVDGWLEVDHLDKHGDGLTEWEINFVESVKQQLKDGRYLSDRQREILDRITEQRM